MSRLGSLLAVLFLLVPPARADVRVEDYRVFHRAAIDYLRDEKWNLALEQLEKAIAAKNDDDRLWTDYGDALTVDPRGVRFGSPTRNARAAEAYRRATQLNPGSARAWNNLAWLFAKTKARLDEGLAAAVRAVEIDRTRAAYLDTLAEVRFARGERAAALEAIERAIELEPDDEGLKRQRKRFQEAR